MLVVIFWVTALSSSFYWIWRIQLWCKYNIQYIEIYPSEKYSEYQYTKCKNTNIKSTRSTKCQNYICYCFVSQLSSSCFLLSWTQIWGKTSCSRRENTAFCILCFEQIQNISMLTGPLQCNALFNKICLRHENRGFFCLVCLENIKQTACRLLPAYKIHLTSLKH